MKWILPVEQIPPKHWKTRLWNIMTVDGHYHIGQIKWFGRWRRYCFFPVDQTVFEQDCLRDIADFIEQKTKEHRELST